MGFCSKCHQHQDCSRLASISYCSLEWQRKFRLDYHNDHDAWERFFWDPRWGLQEWDEHAKAMFELVKKGPQSNNCQCFDMEHFSYLAGLEYGGRLTRYNG